MHKCIKNCTFMGSYWEKGQVCDFGSVTPPHHFVSTTEEATRFMPKPKVDIMSGQVNPVKASTFYQMASAPSNNPGGGMAHSTEKKEVFSNPKQLKVKV